MLKLIIMPAYVIIATLATSVVLVRVSIWLAPKLGFLDVPRGGRTHKQPMPLLAGVAIFASIAIFIGVHAYLLTYGREFLPTWIVPYLPRPNFDAWSKLACIGIAGLCITITGAADDRHNISIGIRLAIMFGIAVMLVKSGVSPTLAHLPEAITLPLTVLWIVGVTNAFNLVDGLDGLAGSLATVAAAAMLVFMIATGQVVVALLLSAIIGVTLGFLVWNWHPAKTYLGSSGSLLLGLLLATVPLISDFMQVGNASLAPALFPVMVLSVPIYDSLSVFILRIMAGRNPAFSDHNHLAHRLLRLGLTVRQAVMLMTLLGIATGVLSLLLKDASWAKATVIMVSAAAMFAVFVILEQTHVIYHDASRIVDIKALGWINRPDPAAGDKSDLEVRMLSAEKVEAATGNDRMPEFAEAMAHGNTVTVTLTPPSQSLRPLEILCSIGSVWKSNNGHAFVGLVPMFPDTPSKEFARQWMKRATYPTREKKPV